MRFLGYFITDLDRGVVIGQFPHLYPAWVAIAYELNGLTGARYVHGLWAIAGVLAVYFLGAALFGRRAGFAAAGLLTLNVAQVWFARYFISEPFLQALIFTALLAFVRSQDKQGQFFAPVAGALSGLIIFVNLSGVIFMAALVAAAIAGRIMGSRLRASFLLPLFGIGAVAGVYYVAVLPHYALSTPVRTAAGQQPALLLALTVVGLAAGILFVRSAGPRLGRLIDRWLPPLTLGIILTLGIYALFFREARSVWTQAPLEREGIVTFTRYYLQPLGLVAALAGWAIVSGERFRRALPFLAVAAGYALFYFYDPLITPDHFWAARRYVPVILPAALLLAGAAVFMPVSGTDHRWLAWCATPRANTLRAAAGGLVLFVLAVQYGAATRPILRHTEHAGMIPAVESLARRIGPNDLLVMPTRNASDAQTFALPLAYIYDRNVLPLRYNSPDPKAFGAFLDWARQRYDRVLFMGSGGTNLLTRRITPKLISNEPDPRTVLRPDAQRVPPGGRFLGVRLRPLRAVAGSRPARTRRDRCRLGLRPLRRQHASKRDVERGTVVPLDPHAIHRLDCRHAPGGQRVDPDPVRKVGPGGYRSGADRAQRPSPRHALAGRRLRTLHAADSP